MVPCGVCYWNACGSWRLVLMNFERFCNLVALLKVTNMIYLDRYIGRQCLTALYYLYWDCTGCRMHVLWNQCVNCPRVFTASKTCQICTGLLPLFSQCSLNSCDCVDLHPMLKCLLVWRKWNVIPLYHSDFALPVNTLNTNVFWYQAPCSQVRICSLLEVTSLKDLLSTLSLDQILHIQIGVVIQILPKSCQWLVMTYVNDWLAQTDCLFAG